MIPSPDEMVTRIMLTCAKARSIAAENGVLDIAVMTDPQMYDEQEPLGLMHVASVMTQGGRKPSAHDVFNLLVLANRTPRFDGFYKMRWVEDLPQAMDALKIWLAAE